jgi:hypothetical protein
VTLHVVPFRLVPSGWENVPAYPGECEDQCVLSDQIRQHLGYAGFSDYLRVMAATRDERQCRGCGRWGLFDYRALPAAQPCRCCNGDPADHPNCTCREPCAWEECPASEPRPALEPGVIYTRPVDGSGPWRRLGRIAEKMTVTIRGL